MIYEMFHILNYGFEIQTNILHSSESPNYNKSHEQFIRQLFSQRGQRSDGQKESLGKRQYQVSELNTPIQCSDSIAFEVERVLFNLTFGNTP